jgi:predicted SprT family Zn-dependent metalloprotease
MPDKATAAKIQEVVEILRTEFSRLNGDHFDSSLKCPQIEFSLRKSFGGYYLKRDHRIVLSWQAYTEYGYDETLNTFRHEVAHIIHLHHRREFWDLAARLGVTRKYAREPLRQRAGRILVYECPACRRLIKRRRRINNSSCARCDRKFNPAYKFRLVKEIRAGQELDRTAA